MTHPHPYEIDLRGFGVAVYYNGHKLDLKGEGSRDPHEVMCSLLAQHLCLGENDIHDLVTDRQGGASVGRVRRLARDLADQVMQRQEPFEITEDELDQLVYMQARCWAPGDILWAPHGAGWLGGNVEEVRHLSDERKIYVAAGTDAGLILRGVFAPHELRHRSKGGLPPWKR